MGSGIKQSSHSGYFSLRAVLLSTMQSAILPSPTAVLFPASTLPLPNLVQMDCRRRSNSLFRCNFLSLHGFFTMTRSRVRLLVMALSDELSHLPTPGDFSKKHLGEESSKHCKAKVDAVSQILSILGIKISARVIREVLVILFKCTTPD